MISSTPAAVRAADMSNDGPSMPPRGTLLSKKSIRKAGEGCDRASCVAKAMQDGRRLKKLNANVGVQIPPP